MAMAAAVRLLRWWRWLPTQTHACAAISILESLIENKKIPIATCPLCRQLESRFSLCFSFNCAPMERASHIAHRALIRSQRANHKNICVLVLGQMPRLVISHSILNTKWTKCLQCLGARCTHMHTNLLKSYGRSRGAGGAALLPPPTLNGHTLLAGVSRLRRSNSILALLYNLWTLSTYVYVCTFTYI